MAQIHQRSFYYAHRQFDAEIAKTKVSACAKKPAVAGKRLRDLGHLP
jgi:hypothetical protein